MQDMQIDVLLKKTFAYQQGSSLLFPMVTVCPQILDTSVLLFNLMQLYPGYTEENLFEEMLALLVEARVKSEMRGREVNVYFYAMSWLHHFFDPCYDDDDADANANADADADADGGAEKEECQFSESALNRTRPTLAGLEGYVEDFYGIALGDGDKVMPTFSIHSRHYKATLSLYSLFMPLFVDQHRTDPDVLRPLSSFEMPVADIAAGDVPSLLAHMIDRDGLLDNHEEYLALNRLVGSALFDLLGMFLGVRNEEVEDVLNAFSYHSHKHPVFGKPGKDPGSAFYKDDEVEGYKSPCGNSAHGNGSMWAFCQDVVASGVHEASNNDTNATMKCMEYCEKVVLDEKMQPKVRELLKMAQPVGTSFRPGYPRILLPRCKFPVLNEPSESGECWRQITTDYGICYSVKTGMCEMHVSCLSQCCNDLWMKFKQDFLFQTASKMR